MLFFYQFQTQNPLLDCSKMTVDHPPPRSPYVVMSLRACRIRFTSAVKFVDIPTDNGVAVLKTIGRLRTRLDQAEAGLRPCLARESRVTPRAR